MIYTYNRPQASEHLRHHYHDRESAPWPPEQQYWQWQRCEHVKVSSETGVVS
jgi:hypothetical protein